VSSCERELDQVTRDLSATRTKCKGIMLSGLFYGSVKSFLQLLAGLYVYVDMLK
jgi:hypothetical protein